MYWEWTDDHSAAWAEPRTSRAWNSLGNQGRWRMYFFFFFKSISPRWTLVSLILSTLNHWHHFGSSGSLWLVLTWLCFVCCNELPTSQLDDHGLMTNAKTWPSRKKKTKTSYLYTLMLTLWVWVVFSCLSKEDVSALRHGTVFIVIGTGFMTNNDRRRLRGICQDSVPPSRDYQVIMHAFFYTSRWGVHIIVIYILEFMLERKHLHPHTPSTHLSPLNHTQTLEWQLVPCKPEISLDCSPV